MTTSEFGNRVLNAQRDLRRMAFKFTGNYNDALDLCQETMLKALVYREKYTPTGNFNSWLYTIMRNTFINQYRRAYRTRYKEQITEGNSKESLRLTSQDMPDRRMVIVEVEQGLSKLTPEYRQPLVKYLQGFKYKEIADQLSIPIGTVKSKIFFARKRLHSILGDYSSM